MFKLWIHVEELSERGDPIGELMEPLDIGCFPSQESAALFLERLTPYLAECSSRREQDEPDRAVRKGNQAEGACGKALRSDRPT